MRWTAAWVLAAALLAAALAPGCGGKDESPAGPADARPPAKSEPEGSVLFRFDRFASATLVDGGEVTLGSLEGRVVLLDLFGTWCPPCRRSTPVLVSLYQRFHERGLEVVGLAYERTADPAGAREAVKGFREEFRIPYTLALGPDVVWQELQAKAQAEGAVPTLLLVDRQGVVRHMFQGLRPGEEAVLAERIEKLLAEPAAPGPP
ncbi:MAG: TlpA family protein disulfide reductase [Planctomycetes bacterium]|nr:TlpA family protein disulfide reductase [Planctomycetota bacterium]